MISFSKNLSYFLLTECKTVLRTYIHHFVLKNQDSFGLLEWFIVHNHYHVCHRASGQP
jgi:hypothetical protein